jgi:hypothetical protein
MVQGKLHKSARLKQKSPGFHSDSRQVQSTSVDSMEFQEIPVKPPRDSPQPHGIPGDSLRTSDFRVDSRSSKDSQPRFQSNRSKRASLTDKQTSFPINPRFRLFGKDVCLSGSISSLPRQDPSRSPSIKLTTRLKCFVLKNINVLRRTCGECAPSCLHSHKCSSSTRVTMYSERFVHSNHPSIKSDRRTHENRCREPRTSWRLRPDSR